MLIWETFQFLSRSRSVGLSGAEAIKVSEIAAYCEFQGIGDIRQRSRLIQAIQKLDAEFLDWGREDGG